ncbi:MAG: transcriptional regulator [Thermodesulfovibrionales bacterium]|nr:transcriptional regulator [Thermodesulfovibrionales bacterium]
MDFYENPTRKQIIVLLKKNSKQSVAELSKQMGITPMAVRQHLMSLEKRGIISYKPKKSGIGRPVFLYSLTDKARDIFPKSYVRFIKDILGIVEEEGGRGKVDDLFMRLKERTINGKYKALIGKSDLEDKVRSLVSILDADGMMVELEDDADSYSIKQFNCLMHSIAGEYPEACKYELQMYRDLLGDNLERVGCQVDGESACTYVVPKQ